MDEYLVYVVDEYSRHMYEGLVDINANIAKKLCDIHIRKINNKVMEDGLFQQFLNVDKAKLELLEAEFKQLLGRLKTHKKIEY